MPTRTRPPQSPPPGPPANKLRRAAALLALAAGAALLELLAGLFAGGFLLTGRAEAFAFLLARPWVVLLAAAAAVPLGWNLRRRAALYALFLLLAGLSEAQLMLRLGNSDPWPEMLRGLAAGAAIALLADTLLSLANRHGRGWTLAAAAVLAVLLALPPARQAYERVVAPPPAAAAPPAGRPEVMLMTALPMVWGEGGAFDPDSRPAALYTALQQEFALRPIDALDAESFAATKLLLLIQPRWLAPEELVALDAWVRDGGRALILTDPRLDWHSELPLGDIRRPPPSGLLKPLLDHWGLALAAGSRSLREDLMPNGRRLITQHAGRLTATGPECRTLRSWLADCTVGRGRALVLADADVVRDELWAAPGTGGDGRNRRLSDNPLVVADLLDQLAGLQRPRIAGDARWRDPGRPPLPALLWALLPLAALAVGAALAPALHRRRRAR